MLCSAIVLSIVVVAWVYMLCAYTQWCVSFDQSRLLLFVLHTATMPFLFLSSEARYSELQPIITRLARSGWWAEAQWEWVLISLGMYGMFPQELLMPCFTPPWLVSCASYSSHVYLPSSFPSCSQSTMCKWPRPSPLPQGSSPSDPLPSLIKPFA